MNPYETLGVPIDATATQIKRAYRDKAKEAHPDKGGNTDQMAQANRAYIILSDPEKRKRYDETGSDKEPDLSGQIHMAFASMAEKIFFNQEGLNAKKGIQAFSDALDRGYNEAREQLRKNRALLESAKARIVKSPEFDLLSGLIAQKLDALTQDEAKNEQDYTVHKKALELIRAYVFKEPEEPPMVRFSFSMTGVPTPAEMMEILRKSR